MASTRARIRRGVLFLAITIVYVLSIGPFVWLFEERVSTTVIRIIYFPIVALAHVWPTFAKAMMLYLALFVPIG